MTDAIFVPGIIRSNVTASIQCNIKEVHILSEGKIDYYYEGGYLNLNNSYNENTALFKVKVKEVGVFEYELFKDLGLTLYYDMGAAAYFKKINGSYFAIATYKKGSNYLIYSLNKNNIENCTENRTIVSY